MKNLYVSLYIFSSETGQEGLWQPGEHNKGETPRFRLKIFFVVLDEGQDIHPFQPQAQMHNLSPETLRGQLFPLFRQGNRLRELSALLDRVFGSQVSVKSV